MVQQLIGYRVLRLTTKVKLTKIKANQEYILTVVEDGITQNVCTHDTADATMSKFYMEKPTMSKSDKKHPVTCTNEAMTDITIFVTKP